MLNLNNFHTDKEKRTFTHKNDAILFFLINNFLRDKMSVLIKKNVLRMMKLRHL